MRTLSLLDGTNVRHVFYRGSGFLFLFIGGRWNGVKDYMLGLHVVSGRDLISFCVGRLKHEVVVAMKKEFERLDRD